MSKRIVWIDIAKGLLIFLVVLGHCEIHDSIKYLIYSFHMGAFFFLSGLTFNTKKPPKQFLIKKVKSLILPYAMFAFVLTMYNFAKHLAFDSVFNLRDAVMSFLLPISGKYESSVYGLWFLPCIFLTELFFYSSVKLYKNHKFISIFYSFVVISAIIVFYSFTQLACVITIIPFALLCICCGYLLKSRLLKLQDKQTVIFGGSLILFVLCVLLNQYFSTSSLDLSSLNLGCIPFYILSTLFGSIVIYTFSMLVEKIKFTKMLIFVGTYSLYFYGFHYEILGLMSYIIKNPYLNAFLTIIVLLPIVFIYTKIKSNIERKINDKCNCSGL